MPLTLLMINLGQFTCLQNVYSWAFTVTKQASHLRAMFTIMFHVMTPKSARRSLPTFATLIKLMHLSLGKDLSSGKVQIMNYFEVDQLCLQGWCLAWGTHYSNWPIHNCCLTGYEIVYLPCQDAILFHNQSDINSISGSARLQLLYCYIKFLITCEIVH